MSAENQSIDTATAEAYERHMVPGMFAHWAERVIGVVAPQPGDQVLDMACGTGIGARIAARFVGPTGKVVGVDMDPGVIEVARRLAHLRTLRLISAFAFRDYSS
jgi:ubiquinone/menaquinone biosynthesis C-methylase UbiE